MNVVNHTRQNRTPTHVITHFPARMFRNIQMTELAMTFFKKGISIDFFRNCFEGQMWEKSSPLHDMWASWRTKWLEMCRDMVLESTGKDKITYFLREKDVEHSFKHWMDNIVPSNTCALFQSHRDDRYISVRFNQPSDHIDIFASDSELDDSVYESLVHHSVSDSIASTLEDEITGCDGVTARV